MLNEMYSFSKTLSYIMYHSQCCAGTALSTIIGTSVVAHCYYTTLLYHILGMCKRTCNVVWGRVITKAVLQTDFKGMVDT